MTDLRFIGDWRLGSGLVLAVALAALAFGLYRRETRGRRDALAWLLPVLRSLAVFLVVLMLAGPVLHHRKLVGELAHVLLLVDTSESMRLTDEAMEVPRKLLVAQQLGWVPPEKFNVTLRGVASRLAAAQAATLAPPGSSAADLPSVTGAFVEHVEAAGDQLAKVPGTVWPDISKQSATFQRELLTPARKLVAAGAGRDARKAGQDLAALVTLAGKWERETRKAFDEHVARVAASNDATVVAALKKLDATPRWQRLEMLLLGGGHSMLDRLASEHQVELVALAGDKAETAWLPGAGGVDPSQKAPQKLPLAPTNSPTNLGDPLRERVTALRGGAKSAVVLFTDGQHNSGASPVEVAKMLGNRGVPLFVVGTGSQHPPPDLAVLDVKGPETTAPDARLQGEVVLKDDMRAGTPFTLRIEHQGTVLWEKQLSTENKHTRAVPFDFPIKDLVAARMRQLDKDLKFTTLPLALKVSVPPVPGEKDVTNNTATLRTTVITQKPKVLLLDGRPRWEFRYLRNLLERDQRWDVNALLAGAGGEQRPWQRGLTNGMFPANRELLFTYSLVVYGDLQRSQVRTDELDWLREFVEKRGGGLVFIDGRQEGLTNLLSTPIAPLLPVRWQGAPLGASPVRLVVKPQTVGAGPLTLLADPVANSETWAGFRGPHWVAPAQALPGAELWVEAESGPSRAAALVFRRFGAGRVLYAAHDESWRWRFEVGDLHHQKFWNQAAKAIMEAPFPVQDKFVSLDSGPANYKPGDTADIRVRLRDAQGGMLLRAKAEAQLSRDGRRVASLPLAADENSGGVYRARTAPLAPGQYEVSVTVEGHPEAGAKARTEFGVSGQSGGEMTHLHCDEALLRQLAHHSGGEFFREEDLGALAERLKPLSQAKVVESDTVLWRSYWWFVPVILLLVVEWVLRKRAGMI
ncbi:MAG: VWA domain-containing protein [Verrucomicrobia bacterium]|nr:VWA domain-containing protein [Verrucomicrobiota bacterium]